MTEEEARKLGFEDVDPAPMTEADARAAGFEDMPDEPSSGGNAGGTFLTNALDALALVGVPAVLAAKDELQYGDKNAPGTSVLDRYRARKAKYAAAKTKDDSASPVAALGGQLSTVLIPGPKGTSIARGAGLGLVHGLLGGSADTAGGDISGTAVDAALGAAGGAGGELLGQLPGRAIKYLGEKAGGRLESTLAKRIKSMLGTYAQRKRDAVQAVKNLDVQEMSQQFERGVRRMGANAPPRQAAGKVMDSIRSQFPQAEADLLDASAGNAGKQIRRFVGSQKRFGNRSGMPDKPYMKDVILRHMGAQGTRAIKDLLGVGVTAGVGATVGGAVLPALGISDREGAAIGAALGGAGKLYLVRKTAGAVLNHPKVLEALGRKLPELGAKLARRGGSLGATTGYLTALLATDRGQRALEEAVQEVGGGGGGGGGGGESGGGPASGGPQKMRTVTWTDDGKVLDPEQDAADAEDAKKLEEWRKKWRKQHPDAPEVKAAPFDPSTLEPRLRKRRHTGGDL